MSRPRFFARRDQSGSWSVIDRVDNATAHMEGVLLVGLGEELANDMARLLVIENRTDGAEKLRR